MAWQRYAPLIKRKKKCSDTPNQYYTISFERHKQNDQYLL